MKLGRRDFLKGLGATAAALLLPRGLASKAEAERLVTPDHGGLLMLPEQRVALIEEFELCTPMWKGGIFVSDELLADSVDVSPWMEAQTKAVWREEDEPIVHAPIKWVTRGTIWSTSVPEPAEWPAHLRQANLPAGWQYDDGSLCWNRCLTDAEMATLGNIHVAFTESREVFSYPRNFRPVRDWRSPFVKL